MSLQTTKCGIKRLTEILYFACFQNAYSLITITFWLLNMWNSDAVLLKAGRSGELQKGGGTRSAMAPACVSSQSGLLRTTARGPRRYASYVGLQIAKKSTWPLRLISLPFFCPFGWLKLGLRIAWWYGVIPPRSTTRHRHVRVLENSTSRLGKLGRKYIEKLAPRNVRLYVGKHVLYLRA